MKNFLWFIVGLKHVTIILVPRMRKKEHTDRRTTFYHHALILWKLNYRYSRRREDVASYETLKLILCLLSIMNLKEEFEGFICPHCMIELASSSQLQDHWIRFHNSSKINTKHGEGFLKFPDKETVCTYKQENNEIIKEKQKIRKLTGGIPNDQVGLVGNMTFYDCSLLCVL